ncbi:HNH endonuclease signature motif containing protein, partial [Ohtaekwangia sp.]|uniref:HNH endonuclease signature motif containing protein n=1 Tax=Ohtaekwangia sp. TaxID=2066019 RepID=UPI002FDDDF5B
LSKQLPSRALYASDGWVDLYSDGIIQSENKFQKIVNGEVQSEIEMSGTPSKTKKITLGEKVASEIDVPSSLVNKLTQQGTEKLRSWLGKTSLRYVDNSGARLSGVAAKEKVCDELNSAISNQTVLNVIEDSDARLLVQCEGVNRNTVYGVVKKQNGDHILYKFEPAYKPSTNPNIDVPLSKNLLAPDFYGSKYLYPITGNQKNIVKIKMTGNRTSDFKVSNQLAGFGNTSSPPVITINGKVTNYTWHHLDDFNSTTGECTMQLVERDAHTAIGMTHTGSVGQYKAFNGSGY